MTEILTLSISSSAPFNHFFTLVAVQAVWLVPLNMVLHLLGGRAE